MKVKKEFIVSSRQQLREHYGSPSEVSLKKVQTSIDRHSADFLSQATFVGLSFYQDGRDLEPIFIGGDKGFVVVQANKIFVKLDSVIELNDFWEIMIDCLENKAPLLVGSIFIIPGVSETVRISGLLQSCSKESKTLVFSMNHGFFHCAKAFMRSYLWNPEKAKIALSDSYRWQGFKSFICVDKRQETEQVSSFYLQPENGESLPLYQPGQYVRVRVNIPGQDSEAMRCYTLSGQAGMNYYRITVKKEPSPDGVSTFLHKRLQIGGKVELSAPAGKFHLAQDSTRPIVLLSAGVGITPMLAILNTLAASKKQREVWFVHGCRNGDAHIMKEYLLALEKQYSWLHLHITYSQPLKSDKQGEHYHAVGRVSIALLESLLPWRDFEYYLCGPEGFLQQLGQGLVRHGVLPQRIYQEAFSGEVKDFSNQGDASTNNQQDESLPPSNVYCQKTGQKLRWDNTYQSLLNLLEAHNIPANYSCRVGDCHSCTYKLLSGEVTYQPVPDEKPDNGCVLLCCAKPRGNVTLDI